MDTIYKLIFGPCHQEIRFGGIFKFTMGERVMIRELVDLVKQKEAEYFLTQTETEARTTSTFLGHLFGQISNDKSTGNMLNYRRAPLINGGVQIINGK